MEGQIELLDYLASLNKKGFDILDYIPTGHDKAVTRTELVERTGINDRAIRVLIHTARWRRIFHTGYESDGRKNDA